MVGKVVTRSKIESKTKNPESPAKASPTGLRANVAYFGAATLIVAATRFATNWLVAAWYGPGEHGRFVVVFQLISMLVIVGELGMVSTFGVRRISMHAIDDRGGLDRVVNDLLGTLYLIQVGLALTLLLAAGPLGAWLGADVHLLRLASAWLIAFGLYRSTMMVCNGLESLGHGLATTALFHGAWLAWLAFSLHHRVSLENMMGGWSIVLPSAAALGWLLLRPLLRRHGLRWRPRMAGPFVLWRTVVAALPYAASLMGTLIVPGVMCLLLVRLRDQQQVSLFAVCYSLGILANLAALPVTGAMLPALTRLLAAEQKDAARAAGLVRRGLVLVAAAVTVAFGLYVFAGRFLLALVGEIYAGQVGVLLLVAAAAAFDGCRLVIDQWLIARGDVRAIAWIELLRYAVLLVAGWWLIPSSGAAGAAAAVLVAILVGAAAKLFWSAVFGRLAAWQPFTLLAILLAGLAWLHHAMPATWMAPAAAVAAGAAWVWMAGGDGRRRVTSKG